MPTSGSRRIPPPEEATRSTPAARGLHHAAQATGGSFPREGAGGIVRMQATAGNAAVVQLLGSSPVMVQRTEESAALLKELAVPTVAEGPAIDVQDGLVTRLEKLVLDKYGTTETWAPDPRGPVSPVELNLGGILVDRLPGADTSYSVTAHEKDARAEQTQSAFSRLTASSGEGAAAVRFVPLGGQGNPNRSGGAAFGEDAAAAELGPALLENSLKTMIDAQQIEYLRLAGLPSEEWKILVELHY